ncbi:MAG TPA: hypothetical protein VGM03_22405 [Phycisphaerae bacterium]|jgi:hypothetical protein
MTDDAPRSPAQDDRTALDAVLDDVAKRRLAGEDIRDEVIIAEYVDLMPALGERLRELARVEQARSRADDTTTSPGAEPDGLEGPSAQPAADSFPGYTILREIHRGRQGVVCQAIQKATKRKVAIKVMREGPFADSRDRARFEREV